MNLLEIPSPPIRGFYIGPLFIYFYSLCILAGVIVAAIWGRKRFVRRGGNPDHFDVLLLAMMVVGVIGARIYHVVTDYQLYFGPGRNPWSVFNFRNGGIGIWGGVVFGSIAALIVCRRYKLDFLSLGDVLAPCVLTAQAIGRWGNWFNQELFGLPTDLPWGLAIDVAHRPDGYTQFEHFHPTFLYESLWCLLGAGVLVFIEKRVKPGRGILLTSYVIWYSFGRFFIDSVRIDPANHVGILRIHSLVTLIAFICALIALAILVKLKLTVHPHPFGKHDDTATVSGEESITADQIPSESDEIEPCGVDTEQRSS